MQERTDDQLDDLFRKSAEETNPPFDPAAWQAMRSRLDAHDRTRTPGYEALLRWGLLGLLSLLLMVGGWYAYRMSETRKTPALTTNARQPAADGMPLTADAPVGTDRTAVTKRSPAETDKARAETNVTEPTASQSEKSTDLAAAKPVGSDVNYKSTGPDRARSAVDRSARQRSATARSAGGRPQRVDEGVPVVGSSTDKPAVAPLLNKPLRGENTAALPRRQRPVAKGLEPSVRRRTERYAVATDRGATTGNVNQIGNRTARASQSESDLEQELNRRPDGTSKVDGQPPTGPPSSDVKPVETVLSHPTDAFTQAVNEPVAMTLRLLTVRAPRWYQPTFAFDRDVVLEPDAARPDADAVPRRPVAPPLPTRGLSIRFVAAPDLSSIGLRNFERPGNNVGLLLEYRLASRWSVQAGVVQSLKRYRASTSDYELPPYMQRWLVLPESISGRCNMLDIPINLRYDFTSQRASDGQVRSRWFVSGGTTTYVMRQEDYYYNYADPNDPKIGTSPYRWSWHGTNTGRFNFSQLNLSAGYERALGRRLAWQIEPYVKMPLRGIGHYNINLLSTGAFFSLRYRL